MAFIWHDKPVGNLPPTWREYLWIAIEVAVVGGGSWLALVGLLLLG
jgi:hypothetical protein